MNILKVGFCQGDKCFGDAFDIYNHMASLRLDKSYKVIFHSTMLEWLEENIGEYRDALEFKGMHYSNNGWMHIQPDHNGWTLLRPARENFTFNFYTEEHAALFKLKWY